MSCRTVGEARHYVHTKLASAKAWFTPDRDAPATHIDLMIGTHYDADHLAGLVDIVENKMICIGEA